MRASDLIKALADHIAKFGDDNEIEFEINFECLECSNASSFSATKAEVKPHRTGTSIYITDE